MPKGFSYQDYLTSLLGERWRTDDIGTTDAALSEQEWNALKPEDRWGMMGTAGGNVYGNATGGGFMIGEDSDIARRWYAGNQRPDYMRSDGGNWFFVSQHKPPEETLRGGAWQDPETGAWVVPHENVRPDYLQQLNDAENRSGLFRGNTLQNILTGAGIVLGGGLAHSALAGGGSLFGGSGVVNAGLDAFEAGSFAAGGAPETAMAANWAPAAGGGASSLADYIPQGIRDAYGTVSDAASSLFTPGPQQLSGPGSTMTGVTTGGGLMPSAGGNIFGIPGLTNGDLLNYGSRLLGTYLNRGDAQDAREASARENQLTREQQLLLAMINQETPYGSVEYSRDPATGAIRRVATMNPADQANLDLRRNIQNQVGSGTWAPPARHGTAMNILGYDLGGNALKG